MKKIDKMLQKAIELQSVQESISCVIIVEDNSKNHSLGYLKGSGERVHKEFDTSEELHQELQKLRTIQEIVVLIDDIEDEENEVVEPVYTPQIVAKNKRSNTELCSYNQEEIEYLKKLEMQEQQQTIWVLMPLFMMKLMQVLQQNLLDIQIISILRKLLC